MPVNNLENKSHNNFFPKRSVWLFCSKVIPVVTFFWVTILYSKRLSYSNYGSFQTIWMYINVLNTIVGFGVPSLILSTDLKFFKGFFAKNKRIIVSGYAALVIIVFILFILFSQQLPLSTRFIVIVCAIVQTISIIKEIVLIKAAKYRFVFTVSLLYSIAFLGWHYYMLRPNFGLNKLLIGIIAVAILKTVFLYSRRIGKYSSLTESSANKNFAGHWFFLGLNDLLGITSKWIDKIFLVYLLTSSEFALFFNGSFEIPLFGLLVSTIGMITILEMASFLNNKEKVSHVFSECFVLLSGFVFPLFFFLLLFNKELFYLFFSDKYNASIPIFIISIFILPVRINNYTTILQCYEKGNQIIIGSLLDIFIAFILMLLLYPIMGTEGIALSVVLATYIQALYYLHQSAKILQISIWRLVPIKNLLMRIFIIGSLYILLHLVLLNTSPLIRILVAGTITLLLVSAFLYLFIKKEKIYHEYSFEKGFR